MQVFEIHSSIENWECPWCGNAKVALNSYGKRDRECSHFIASSYYSEFKEDGEILIDSSSGIVKDKNFMGVRRLKKRNMDEVEFNDFIRSSQPEIEVRLVQESDPIDIVKYASFFYREAGIPRIK